MKPIVTVNLCPGGGGATTMQEIGLGSILFCFYLLKNKKLQTIIKFNNPKLHEER